MRGPLLLAEGPAATAPRRCQLAAWRWRRFGDLAIRGDLSALIRELVAGALIDPRPRETPALEAGAGVVVTTADAIFEGDGGAWTLRLCAVADAPLVENTRRRRRAALGARGAQDVGWAFLVAAVAHLFLITRPGYITACEPSAHDAVMARAVDTITLVG